MTTILNKRILLSLGMIVFVGAAVIGATGAFFSDTETSTGNTFTAGAIDLKVDSQQHYNNAICVGDSWALEGQGADPTNPQYPVIGSSCGGTWALKDLAPTSDKFFNFGDVKPGDSGENTISLHVINNDAYVCATVFNLASNDNGLTEPEGLVDTTDGAGNGELDEEMLWTVWRDDGDNVQEGGEVVLTSGNPTNGVLTVYDSTTGPLAASSTAYLGVSWSLPGASGNKTQTDSLTGDISFQVVQSRNNGAFKCSDVTGPTTAVVYNSIPDPLAGNYPSKPFQAQQASEFGGQILLTGTNRTDPEVTVMMSSWGCEAGNWNLGTCLTTPGATFTHPVTLNLYNVGSGNSVGTLIATQTQTFAIPYRPSADNINCTGANAGKWWNGTACSNGKATPISFNLTGVTLPNNVIVSVAYNTTNYGYSPMGATACSVTTQGCGYDSLNVALNTLGSVVYPLPNGAYFNSITASAYGDNGVGGTGTFRLDPTGWTGNQPIVKVKAN